MQNRSPLMALLALAFGLLPSGVFAQAGPATAHVQRLNAQVDALMARALTTDTQRTERDARVGTIIEQLLDYDAFARSTLGSEWEPRTEDERREFQDLLTQNIRRNYLRSLERIRDYRIEYVGEEPIAGGVVVHARAQSVASRREPAIAIDYAMHRVDGAWRVYDITTDGASLVVGQGSRFRRFIAQHGWTEFMNSMREHLAHPAG